MGGDVESPSHWGGYMVGNVESFPHTGEGTWVGVLRVSLTLGRVHGWGC